MHRTRIGLSDENSKKWSAECRGQAQILFISIPKNEVSVFGDFEKILSGWLPNNDSENHAIVPIHEGQYRQIQKYFPNAKLIPGYSKSAWAQTSVHFHFFNFQFSISNFDFFFFLIENFNFFFFFF